MNGIVLVNKPANLTSRDVVNLVSKKLNIKKIGHTGTLDPLATGVLVLTVNQATKISELITSYDKEYIAEVVLGIETDTLDITGNILKETKTRFTKKEIENVLNKMIGFYDQEVPIYSAVKINGKRLYEYARSNEEVLLPKRLVNIKSLELVSDIDYIDNKTVFKIKCLVSKGTYIRSLIKDLASNLNTIGTMKNLTRTKQGNFKIEDSVLLSEVDNSKIIPLKDCLNNYFQVSINDDLFNKVKHGQILDNIYNKKEVVFVYRSEVIAIYKEYQSNKLKPWKMFV